MKKTRGRKSRETVSLKIKKMFVLELRFYSKLGKEQMPVIIYCQRIKKNLGKH
jgi:hypothetical protein